MDFRRSEDGFSCAPAVGFRVLPRRRCGRFRCGVRRTGERTVRSGVSDRGWHAALTRPGRRFGMILADRTFDRIRRRPGSGEYLSEPLSVSIIGLPSRGLVSLATTTYVRSHSHPHSTYRSTTTLSCVQRGTVGSSASNSVGSATSARAMARTRVIVIIVGLFRIDRTTACGHTGKSLQ